MRKEGTSWDNLPVYEEAGKHYRQDYVGATDYKECDQFGYEINSAYNDEEYVEQKQESNAGNPYGCLGVLVITMVGLWVASFFSYFKGQIVFTKFTVEYGRWVIETPVLRLLIIIVLGVLYFIPVNDIDNRILAILHYSKLLLRYSAFQAVLVTIFGGMLLPFHLSFILYVFSWIYTSEVLMGRRPFIKSESKIQMKYTFNYCDLLLAACFVIGLLI